LKTTFLSDKDGWNQIIKEESQLWVEDVVKKLNLDSKIVFGNDKHKAVRHILDNKIAIEYNQKDSCTQIFKENKMIAEWKVLSIRLKRDKDNSFYNEIDVDSWSVIDNQPKPKEKKTKK
jgi:hypothetical protein